MSALVLFLKYWAKKKKIQSKNCLKSYALQLMVICFLQQKRFLPYLQQLNQKQVLIESASLPGAPRQTINIWFESDLQKIREHMSRAGLHSLDSCSLISLVQRFFKFMVLLSMKGGCKISITRSSLALPPETEFRGPYYIEDPFDPTVNVGDRPNDPNNIERVRREFRAAYKHLRLGLSISDLVR